jgi:peptidyl-prolyl cis-trans isomerase D
VVETQFGYHIIDVTELKDNSAYYFAILEREITPSDATINDVLRKAELFATSVNNPEDFVSLAEKEGYTVYDAKGLAPSDRRVSTLGDARQIVQWLYRDGEIGKVSEVFDLQYTYVVAVMTGEIEKGYKSLAEVRDEISTAVKNEVKGRVIIGKLSGLTGSLDEIAAAFGKDANVYSKSDLKLSNNSLTSVGFDPIVVGLGYSLESGQRSKPFAGENGVVIIEIQNKTVAPEIADYSLYKNQLEQNVRNRSSFNIAEAIKENANIADRRYRFY